MYYTRPEPGDVVAIVYNYDSILAVVNYSPNPNVVRYTSFRFDGSIMYKGMTYGNPTRIVPVDITKLDLSEEAKIKVRSLSIKVKDEYQNY